MGKPIAGFESDQYIHVDAKENPETGVSTTPHLDFAGIKRRLKVAPAYLIRDGRRVQMVIIPILWERLRIDIE